MNNQNRMHPKKSSQIILPSSMGVIIIGMISLLPILTVGTYDMTGCVEGQLVTGILTFTSFDVDFCLQCDVHYTSYKYFQYLDIDGMQFFTLGNPIDSMGCTENPCTTRFIPYSTPVNDIIGYYTCESACQEPGFKFTTADVGGTSIQRCGDCNNKCETCISRDECLSCTAGHFQSEVQYECLPCNELWGHCTSCTSSQCFTCLQQTFIDPRVSQISFGKCIPCSNIQNCQQCNPFFARQCTKCVSRFYLNYSSLLHQCVSCSDFDVNCETCGNGPRCMTCLPGYGLDYISNMISSNPLLNSQICVICTSIANCKNCTDGPICTQCLADYFFNVSSLNYQCVLCSSIQNCQDCTLGPLCMTCKSGFFKNLSIDTHQCVQCPYENCRTCDHGPICIDCIDSYFPNTSITTGQVCVPCSSFPNCRQCQTGKMQCLDCQANFYHDFSTVHHYCVPCTIWNCLLCDDGPTCKTCEVNYIIDTSNSNQSCLSCSFDEYQNANQCHKCSNQDPKCINCLSLGNSINCTRCQPNCAIQKDTWLCIQCSVAIKNCITCSDADTCNVCKYPFKPDPFSKCDTCADGFEMLEVLCVKPKGCFSMLPDFSRCLGCFTQHNFFFDQKKNQCLCQKGYVLEKVNATHFCVDKCGNGIVTSPNEECDDGNQRDNDGCNANCKVQQDFICNQADPSDCVLQWNITGLLHNYARRVDGQNRAVFSFSVSPRHSSFKCFEWSKYLTLNLTSEHIVAPSLSYAYQPQSNEVTVNFEYAQTLEGLVIQATLSFGQKSVKSVQVTQASVEERPVSATSSAGQLSIFSIPSQLSIALIINGQNSILSFEDQSLLLSGKASSMGFMVTSIITLVLFLIASYFHKMIGIETIHIFQFLYFLTIIVDQNKAVFLKSLNVLKYTAFGGYSDYVLFYGDIQNEAKMVSSLSVDKGFLFVGLLKYFALNVNLLLIVPTVALIMYMIKTVLKFKKRSDYLKSREQLDKDLYTVKRRESQWIYDHCVFPSINIFSMIGFFCTVLELESGGSANITSEEISEEALEKLEFVAKTSFIPNAIMVFLTFLIVAYELFASYAQYKHSRLTPEEKAKTPSSMVEKLEHDQNNPDRENFKPGYVLVYLLYYFLVQIVLTLNILVKQLGQYGMDFMLGLSFVYLLIVLIWRPYNEVVSFHNRALILNHFTATFFALTCEIFNRLQISETISVILVYANLLLLAIVTLFGFVRLYVEHQFRKKLQDDPTLMDEKKVEKLEINDGKKYSRKQKLLLNNKYTLEGQIRSMVNPTGGFLLEQRLKCAEDQIEQIKKEMRKDISGRKKHSLHINEGSISDTFIPEKMKMNQRLREKLTHDLAKETSDFEWWKK